MAPDIRIFVSYTNQDARDKELAASLATRLRQSGAQVYHAPTSNLPGDTWRQNIRDHITHCDVFLVIISAASLTSEQVLNEIAQARVRYQHDASLRVVPLRVGQTPKYRGKDFIDRFQWQEYDQDFEKLFQRLCAAIGGDPHRLDSRHATLVENGMGPQHDEMVTAPSSGRFFGRERERMVLKQWILVDHCRVVALVGIGGIGKTSLAAALASEIKAEFQYVLWYSLQDAPPLQRFVEKCILDLSNQQQLNLPKELEDQLRLLTDYLRKQRCLLILDNIETVLQAGSSAGQFRQEYAGYGRLIQTIGETVHQSCLLLTSREKPREIARDEGTTSLVRSMDLAGVDPTEGKDILQDKDLIGSESEWARLVQLYSGNPLALKLAAEPIQRLFGGDIGQFLNDNANGRVIGDIYVLEHLSGSLSR